MLFESNRGSCGFYISLKSQSIKDAAVSLMVATGQEMVGGKKFFKVREKSANFTLSQEKVKGLKEVREK